MYILNVEAKQRNRSFTDQWFKITKFEESVEVEMAKQISLQINGLNDKNAKGRKANRSLCRSMV